MAKKKHGARKSKQVVTLKALAERVGLTPGTISAVLNASEASKAIPQHTQDRILLAARELNYQPNFFARTLRSKRTYTVGVIAQEIGDAYSGPIISGIESYLRDRNYFFLTGIHRHDPKLFDQYSQLLLRRGVEGFITIDLNLPHSLPLPTVAIAGHRRYGGVTNIVLDHRRAAELAISHLLELGHERIAFMRGNPASSDSETRWQNICAVADDLDVKVRPELKLQIETEESSPELGYGITKRLLTSGEKFTALFAYNDLAAIGAIRAIREAGLEVPTDVSVVGFDDIEAANYHSPTLTTVRQPLKEMGEIAAKTLMQAIESKRGADEIAIKPQLMVRQSTVAARKK
jgi:LacI family transcriptional regulator, galactose operon repressor